MKNSRRTTGFLASSLSLGLCLCLCLSTGCATGPGSISTTGASIDLEWMQNDNSCTLMSMAYLSDDRLNGRQADALYTEYRKKYPDREPGMSPLQAVEWLQSQGYPVRVVLTQTVSKRTVVGVKKLNGGANHAMAVHGFEDGGRTVVLRNTALNEKGAFWRVDRQVLENSPKTTLFNVYW